MAAILASLAADQALTALVVTACALTIADLATGIGAAARTQTFALDTVGCFIESHVVGRVLPIVVVALLGHWVAALMVIAGLAASAYGLETVGSIRASLGLPVAPAA